MLALVPLQTAVDRLEHTARLRSAARLGVATGTVPRHAGAGAAWLTGLALLVPWTSHKARGRPTTIDPWPVYLAMRTINAVSERRSWRRAYRG